MTGGAFFLLVAVLLSVVGSVAFWWKQRKPKTFMSSIDDFQREMGALGHDTPAPRRKDGDRLTPIVPAPGPGDLARKLRDARRLAGDGDPSVHRREQER